MLLQLSQFAFWEKNAPLFWKVLRANALGFFEDDGEISLSRLSSLIASSPTTFQVDSATSAFRFQRIGKEAWADLNLAPQNPEEDLPEKVEKMNENQVELVRRASEFLKKLFFVDLPNKKFQCFPVLPPRQHHYPPSVKLAAPPPPTL